MKFRYSLSTSSAALYKVKPLWTYVYIEGMEREIYPCIYLDGEWGENSPIEEYRAQPYPLPHGIVMRWWSAAEQKCYFLSSDIDRDKAEEEWTSQESQGELAKYNYVVIGLAPYGGVAVWLRGYLKSTLLHWMKGEETSLMPLERDKMDEAFLTPMPIIPPKDIFDHWMMQFHYRYVPLEEYWDGEKWQEYDEEDTFYDDIMINELRVQRFDGTHHELPGDFSLIKYHEAGMPKRMALRWDEGHTHLSAYWWFDDQVLYPILHRFFSLNPDARADILLRCDSRQECFEIALKSGEMLQQPITILPEAYQLIVFKDGHELYKSENYNQEQGAWNW